MKSIKNIFYITIISILYTSCTDCTEINDVESETNSSPVICLETSDPISKILQECNQIHGGSTMSVCEWITLNDTLKLNDDWAAWLPSYCNSIGDSLTFINSQGDETFFTLESKSNSYYNAPYFDLQHDFCPDGNWIVYCRTVEDASITLKAEILDIDLSVRIQPNFSYLNEIDDPRLVLTIRHDIPFDFVSHLIANVVPSVNSSGPPSHTFIEEKDFGDSAFYNLHTYQNPITDLAVKMYYNKEFGIVAFEDYDGIEWRLKIE